MPAITAADGFALTMILILALGLGFVFVILFAIHRNMNRHDREVDELLDELRKKEDDPERQPKPRQAAGTKREAWERDSDWWKQS